MPTAVIIDVPSIQKFVFGNNKMRLNVGASYIIKELYQKIIDLTGYKLNLEAPWYNPLAQPPQSLPAIGYHGGGNLLLFFDDNLKAKQFINAFSIQLIHAYPGLTSIFGIKDNFIFDVKNEENEKYNFQDLLKQLHEDELAVNKNKYHIQTNIPIQSLSAVCDFNMLPAHSVMKYMEGGEEIVYLYSELAEKQKDAEENLRINEKNDNDYTFLENPDTYKYYYRFPRELEYLGQKDENSYISIVHLDGNAVGHRIKNCQTLPELQVLSKKINSVFTEAFKKVLTDFCREHMPFLIANQEYLNIKRIPDSELLDAATEHRNIGYYLPFRPLMVSADDINFVAEGRLGIYLAEKILLELQGMSIGKEKGNGNIIPHACAGIAIAGTKFPFYQAYNIAEKLCGKAKQAAMYEDKDNPQSYLQFTLISSTGMMKDFNRFMDLSYTINGLNAKGGPYKVDRSEFEDLKNKARRLREWSGRRRHELREIINGTDAEKELLKIQLSISKGEKDLPKNELTHYDALEMIDFYPFFLEDRGK